MLSTTAGARPIHRAFSRSARYWVKDKTRSILPHAAQLVSAHPIALLPHARPVSAPR